MYESMVYGGHSHSNRSHHLYLPQTVSPTRDQVFKCLSLWGKFVIQITSAYCFCREANLDFQHLCLVVHNLVQGMDSFWPLSTPALTYAFPHTNIKQTKPRTTEGSHLKAILTTLKQPFESESQIGTDVRNGEIVVASGQNLALHLQKDT